MPIYQLITNRIIFQELLCVIVSAVRAKDVVFCTLFSLNMNGTRRHEPSLLMFKSENDTAPLSLNKMIWSALTMDAIGLVDGEETQV